MKKGSNGGQLHLKLCQCKDCVERRFEEYKERIDGYAKQGVIPRTVDQTVMVKEYTVRPHFRRNGRHLTNDTALRRNVEHYLSTLMRRTVRR